MVPESTKNILVVAGEASGDMHGAKLVQAVRTIDPGITFWGIGGAAMREAGVEILLGYDQLAVVGISEVFTHIVEIARAQHAVRSAMRQRRPDLAVLIDYPDFNLMLATKAKALGIPVAYYISPQVWAWRSGRVKKIRRVVDKMMVILPFEVDVYRNSQIDVSFVGHPLLDVVEVKVNDSEIYRRYALDRSAPIVGLFPGSRPQEIRRLMPCMVEAARIAAARVPGTQFVLPVAPAIDKEYVRRFLPEGGPEIKVIDGGAYETMRVAKAVIAASGTVTLEAAIMQVPMVIVYRVSRLSYLVAKALVKVRDIGLVNLVAGRRIVPELVQEEASGERIAEEVSKILMDEKHSQSMKSALEGVRNSLGARGASQRAAEIVHRMLTA